MKRLGRFLWGIQFSVGVFVGLGLFYLASSVDKKLWTDLLSSQLFWGFILGMVGTYITSFVNKIINGYKVVKEAERAILRSITEPRLRKSDRSDDRHWLIRTEWAANLRDLGSKREKDILRAAEEFFYMADLLEADERSIAREAMRLRMGFHNSQNVIDKFIRAMEKLKDNGN